MSIELFYHLSYIMQDGNDYNSYTCFIIPQFYSVCERHAGTCAIYWILIELAKCKLYLCSGSPQNHLIEPVVAPRFAFTCSQPLLRTLGDLASEMEVPVHSHICQQKEEVTKILYNYPQHRDCASIFDAAGMLNSRVCRSYCQVIAWKWNT